MLFPIPITVWGAVLIGVTAGAFVIGTAFGGRSFAHAHIRVILGYTGGVAAIWFIAVVDAVARVETVTIISLAIEIVAGIVLTVACPVLAVYFVAEARLRRSVRLDDPKVCRQCQYNLTGNVSGVCPECGTHLTRDQRRYLDRNLRWDDIITWRR